MEDQREGFCRHMWVCLKMGYTPNEAIKSRDNDDNDQQNPWVFWGTQHFQTNPMVNSMVYSMVYGGCIFLDKWG